MKKLEQIRQESKEIKDKIDNTEERLRQEKIKKKDIKTRHSKKKKRKNS